MNVAIPQAKQRRHSYGARSYRQVTPPESIQPPCCCAPCKDAHRYGSIESCTHGGIKFSIRKAAEVADVPFTTFYAFYQSCMGENPEDRRDFQLTQQEEPTIRDLLLRYEDMGRPMTSGDLCDAVEMLVATFPEERRKKMRYVNGRPGRAFVRYFYARHKQHLKYGRASPQEAQRFAATNASVLTEYFARVERVMREYDIDATRICNLDESGFTPNRDSKRAQNPKVFSGRGQRAELIEPQFSNVSRVTMMAVVFGDGSLGRPFFVFGGTKMRYRTVFCSGRTRTESIVDCLPRGAVATTRDGAPGVDSANFLRYMRTFVEDVRDRTARGRKVLLLYDAYRPHMTFKVLELLRKNNVIAFALPAHTSGTTQPLDVSCFSPWKHEIRSAIRRLATNVLTSLDEFDLCNLLRHAYTHAFTPANIKAGFKKSGLWPLCPEPLLGKPRVLSADEMTTVLGRDELHAMLEQRRASLASSVGVQPVVGRHGFIDTSCGVNLTSTSALELVRKKELVERMKKAAEAQKQAARELKDDQKRARKRKTRADIEKFAMTLRAQRWGTPLQLPRSLRIRRDIAAHNARLRRAVSGTAGDAASSLLMLASTATEHSARE